jgi:hypothetical protein
VVREGERLVLHREPDGLAEAPDLAGELRRPRVELQAVVSDVLDPFHADEAARVGAGTPAHAGDEEIAPGEPLQLGSGVVGNGRQLRARDDRRQGAVDVEDQRASLGSAREWGEERGGLHRPA